MTAVYRKRIDIALENGYRMINDTWTSLALTRERRLKHVFYQNKSESGKRI